MAFRVRFIAGCFSRRDYKFGRVPGTRERPTADAVCCVLTVKKAVLIGFEKVCLSRGSRTGVLSTLIFLCTAAGNWGAAAAQITIHVPQDQPTIHAGITAAANGDTVLVAPGTYKENIDFDGKNITVTSSGGAASTIIDAGGNGVVVTFDKGETSKAVLNGFTIQNGGPGTGAEPVQSDGIYIQNADPTITNNIITNNRGYGIQIADGAALIQGNTISYTTTQYNPAQDYGCDYDDGSGISIAGNPNGPFTTIEGNTIEFNVAHCGGGGILMDYAPAAHIVNNRILYNQTLGQGGGGIYMGNGSQVWIVQNLIAGNVAASMGGGIDVDSVAGQNGKSGPINSYIVSNTIVGNTIVPNLDISSPEDEDGSQIGFPAYASQTGLYNNVIVAADSYSAIACDPIYSYLSATPPVVTASDVYSLSGKAFGGWCTAQAGTSAGVYNYISSDPMLALQGSEPFRLEADSPALATGNPAAPNLLTTDLDGNPRTQVGSSGGQVVDMGVYEGAVTTHSSGDAPTFTLQPSSTNINLAYNSYYGMSGTIQLSIAPQNNLLGTISFGCSGLPTSIIAACYFSPAAVAVAGDNTPLNVTLRIEDQGYVAALRPNGSRPLRQGQLFSCFLALLLPFGAVAVGRRSRHIVSKFLLLTICVVLSSLIMASLSACGGAASGAGAGGGGGSGGGGGTAGNPSKSYSATITASSNGNAWVTQTIPVTFSVPAS